MAKRRTVSRATLISQSRQVPSEEKALVHNVTGRTIRRFFDVSEDDQKALGEKLETIMAMRIKRV